MNNRAVVIISTAEAEKAYTGPMYAVNALNGEPAAFKFIADENCSCIL